MRCKSFLVCCLSLFFLLGAMARNVEPADSLLSADSFLSNDSVLHADSFLSNDSVLPADSVMLDDTPDDIQDEVAEIMKADSDTKSTAMKEVIVRTKRTRYSRKNNPAVDLMQKVIDSKKQSDLHHHDYFSYRKYEKTTTSLNEVTPLIFNDSRFKRLPFLKEHVELCKETGKLILPLIVEEKVTRHIFRKQPGTEKDIVEGQRSDGVNDLLSSGDIVNTAIQDIFTDVDIYENDVRLFQSMFTSPISSINAIRFYRYYITDTLMVGRDKCYKVDFTPNNPQDFGFSGSLWIMADSTYRVKQVHLSVPRRSDVNFIDRLDIYQDFIQLTTGEQVMNNSKMIAQLKIANWLQKAQVERMVYIHSYEFDELPRSLFRFNGNTKQESFAYMRDEDFWKMYRPEKLTHSESKMSLLLKRLQNAKGMKGILWMVNSVCGNYLETSANPEKPSKIDFGPLSTLVSQNFVEGFKLRGTLQTTANLNPHWFGRAYLGYGFGDKRLKGCAELTYSFNKKKYLPREFPKHNLMAQYYYDVIAPVDRFLQLDKDNIFASFKWAKQEHMTYVQRFILQYEREWNNGIRFISTARRERIEAAGNLFFQPLDSDTSPFDNTSGSLPLTAVTSQKRFLTTSDLAVGLEYQPGVSWVSTKRRRIKMSEDAPIFAVQHTVGFNGFLQGEYNYNLTEITLYKRFWLRTWGKFDVFVQSQCQWNKVPFPLLCYPSANLSYIIQPQTFSLINNMEFITDRNATVMFSWDLNGKIFNRIPGFNRLKLREFLACNMYFGYLSDKNNPSLPQNAGDGRLYYFPGHYEKNGTFSYTSQQLKWYRPYVELIAGIHNIFKILHVEYVHRINYLHPSEGFRPQCWGIRLRLRTQF